MRSAAVDNIDKSDGVLLCDTNDVKEYYRGQASFIS